MSENASVMTDFRARRTCPSASGRVRSAAGPAGRTRHPRNPAIRLARYTSSGNTFMIVDETRTPLADDAHRAAFASWALGESFGIGGADNVLYIRRLVGPRQHSARPVWAFRIFEHDGAETLFCGNGLLSMAAELRRLYGGQEWPVMTELPTGRPRMVRIGVGPSAGQAWVGVGAPRPVPAGLYQQPQVSADGTIDVVSDLTVPLPTGQPWTAGLPPSIVLSGLLVFTGEPHLVLFCGKGLPAALEARIFPAGRSKGEQFRASSQLVAHIGAYVNTAYRGLFPAGVHLNFARIVDYQVIEYRTYERGIHRETLACGSGAVATAHVAAHLKLVSSTRVTLWPYRSRLYRPDSRLWVDAGPSGYVLRGSPQLICTSTVPAASVQMDGTLRPPSTTCPREVAT